MPPLAYSATEGRTDSESEISTDSESESHSDDYDNFYDYHFRNRGNISDAQYLFSTACASGDPERVQEFLSDLSVDVNLVYRTWGNKTGLHIAAMRNHWAAVEVLLSDPRVDRNIKDGNGLTVFQQCIVSGRSGILELLLADLRTDVTPYNLMWVAEGLLVVKMMMASRRYSHNDARLRAFATGLFDPEAKAIYREYEEHPLEVTTRLRAELGW